METLERLTVDEVTDSSLLAPEAPDLVWFKGPDTIRFLNDLISQEIADLEPGTVVRSLLLGPQGKLDHILWVLRGTEEVGLLTDNGRGGELATSLGRYRIRVDVEIEASSKPAWIVVGDRVVDQGSWEHHDDGLAADVSWRTVERSFVTGAKPNIDVMTAEQYEALRIEAGEPRWGADVDESTIPHESGLVPATVDFAKGCFLGQELVARIDSRGGNVPRHLRLLDMGDVQADTGSVVVSGGDAVGNVTSQAGGLALAVIKRGVEPGDEVMVKGVPVVVRSLRP